MKPNGIVAMLALAAASLFVEAAHAGRSCEQKPLTVDAVTRGMALANTLHVFRRGAEGLERTWRWHQLGLAGVFFVLHSGMLATYQQCRLSSFVNENNTDCSNVAYNAYQKNKAQQQAAAQWRLLNQGQIIFTTQRLSIAGNMGWLDMPYANIRATGQDGDGILLFFDGQPRLKLRMWNPLTHFVLLRYLAYGDVPPPALPPAG